MRVPMDRLMLSEALEQQFIANNHHLRSVGIVEGTKFAGLVAESFVQISISLHGKMYH